MTTVRKIFKIIPQVLLVLPLSACSFSSLGGHQVKVSVSLPGVSRSGLLKDNHVSSALIAGTQPSLPSSWDQFNCYAVNVFGPNLGSGWGGFNNCGPAATSKLVPLSQASEIALKVPAGPQRTVQVIGVMTADGTCPNQTLGDFWNSQSTPNGGPPTYNLATLGQTTTDLFQDTEVTVHNTYTSGGSNTWPFQCNAGPSYLPLSTGYQGPSTANNFSDTIPGGTGLPLSASQWVSPGPVPIVLSAAEITQISNPSNSSTLYYTSNSFSGSHARLDLLYNVSGVNLTQYSVVQITGSIGAGLSSICGGTPSSGTGGADIAILNMGGGWQQLSGTGGGTYNPVSFNISTAGLISANSVGFFEGGGTYIHISIRSTDTQATFCATLGINNLQITLLP